MTFSSSRFQPGEGPSRGLLRDYEPSDGTFRGTTEYVCHNNITWPLLVSPSTQLVALLRGPDCGVLHPPDEIPRGGVAVVVGVGAAQPAASRGLM